MSDAQTPKMMSVPKWDGKGKTFQGWWMQFMTFAVLCNFLASIGSEIDPDLPSSEDAPISDDKQGKNQKYPKCGGCCATCKCLQH